MLKLLMIVSVFSVMSVSAFASDEYPVTVTGVGSSYLKEMALKEMAEDNAADDAYEKAKAQCKAYGLTTPSYQATLDSSWYRSGTTYVVSKLVRFECLK